MLQKGKYHVRSLIASKLVLVFAMQKQLTQITKTSHYTHAQRNLNFIQLQRCI